MDKKIRLMKVKLDLRIVTWGEKNRDDCNFVLIDARLTIFNKNSCFQAWLTKTESGIANEDSPSSLAEAEKLLSQHQQIREEIDSYTNDYR